MESTSEQAEAELARHATPDGAAPDRARVPGPDFPPDDWPREQATSIAADRGGIPHTGDAVIDAAIAELAQVRRRPLAEHIPAGENAHRILQSRLNDLGGE